MSDTIVIACSLISFADFKSFTAMENSINSKLFLQSCCQNVISIQGVSIQGDSYFDFFVMSSLSRIDFLELQIRLLGFQYSSLLYQISSH